MGDEAHRDEQIRTRTAQVRDLRRAFAELRLDRIHPGEPVYVLRAQDLHAPAVIRHWADLAQQRGTPMTKVASARLVAQDMETWASANRTKVKVPD